MNRTLPLLAAGVALGIALSVAAMFVWRARAPEEPPADPLEDARGDFTGRSEPDAGLGPGFNADSCVSCHHIPEAGGSSLMTTLRIARRGTDGRARAYPGSAIVHTFHHGASACRPIVPSDAAIFSRRLATTTFGSGSIDAIADDVLIALEDPDDRDGDGISGRAARVFDRASGTTRIGRFGWKAQQASLLAFSADAYAHEMGVTNDLYPEDALMGATAETIATCDEVADPEDQPDGDARAIDRFVAFMRSLPAPSPAPLADGGAGAQLFTAAGCAACHMPEVGGARAYSDFLLHDIGTGDGIPEGDASGDEMRTAPLWGLASRVMFLHDGSAVTVEDAIARHGNEAAAARQRFDDLSAHDRARLSAFVKSR